MFDWDDARTFLAAARAGTLAAASSRIGVDAATVGRRIARLETALKSTLLIRSPSGLQLTTAGSRFLEAVTEAERAMEAAGLALRPEAEAGTVRISAAEGFGTTILAPALPEVVASWRGLRIELAANPGFLSPSRREVDLAITLSPPDAANLIVEPLTDYRLALYASDAYLAANGAPADIGQLADHVLVGYVRDLIYAPELRYLDEIAPMLEPRLASSSIRAQREIIAAGGGIGILPCFMAEGLTQILPEAVLLHRRFWLSAHQDLYHTARLKKVRRWLRTLCEKERPRLMPG